LKNALKQSTSKSPTDFCSFERRGLERLSRKTTERIKKSDEDIKTGRKIEKETSKYSNDRVASGTDIGTGAAKLDLDLNCKVKLMR